MSGSAKRRSAGCCGVHESGRPERSQGRASSRQVTTRACQLHWHADGWQERDWRFRDLSAPRTVRTRRVSGAAWNPRKSQAQPEPRSCVHGRLGSCSCRTSASLNLELVTSSFEVTNWDSQSALAGVAERSQKDTWLHIARMEYQAEAVCVPLAYL